MFEALAAVASIALPAVRSGVRHQQELHHARELHAAEAAHAQQLLHNSLAERAALFSREGTLAQRRHALAMAVAHSLARREELRDAWQQRTWFVQTVLLNVSLMLSVVFIALTQSRAGDVAKLQYTGAVDRISSTAAVADEAAANAVPWFDSARLVGCVSLARRFGVELWMGAAGFAVAALFGALWLCQLVQRRIGRFRVLPSLADAGATAAMSAAGGKPGLRSAASVGGGAATDLVATHVGGRRRAASNAAPSPNHRNDDTDEVATTAAAAAAAAVLSAGEASPLDVGADIVDQIDSNENRAESRDDDDEDDESIARDVADLGVAAEVRSVVDFVLREDLDAHLESATHNNHHHHRRHHHHRAQNSTEPAESPLGLHFAADNESGAARPRDGNATAAAAEQQQRSTTHGVTSPVQLRDLTGGDIVRLLHCAPTALANDDAAAVASEASAERPSPPRHEFRPIEGSPSPERAHHHRTRQRQPDNGEHWSPSGAAPTTGNNASFAYSCGNTHRSFNGYYDCHCEPLRRVVAALLAVGMAGAVLALAALHAMLLQDVFHHPVSAFLVLGIVLAAGAVGAATSWYWSDDLLPPGYDAARDFMGMAQPDFAANLMHRGDAASAPFA